MVVERENIGRFRGDGYLRSGDYGSGTVTDQARNGRGTGLREQALCKKEKYE